MIKIVIMCFIVLGVLLWLGGHGETTDTTLICNASGRSAQVVRSSEAKASQCWSEGSFCSDSVPCGGLNCVCAKQSYESIGHCVSY